MKRRDFLRYAAVLGAAATLGSRTAHAGWLRDDGTTRFPQGMYILDAHGHPDIYPCTPSFCDTTSTIEKIRQVGMNGSAFAVTEDLSGLQGLLDHCDIVVNFEDEGRIRIIKRYSDLALSRPPYFFSPFRSLPAALFSVEGATPLGTDVENVDLLYRLGVRLITPMHKMTNQFGYVMKYGQPPDPPLPADLPPPTANGLTEAGDLMIDRMMKRGIIVDGAHAYIATLRGMAEVALRNGVPIIDSHTSLTHMENPYGTTRARTIDEMKIIASTGGVVCTWPLGHEGRRTFLDWAEETREIAGEIGIDHVGLGTDGGGGLPELIDGYTSILDLPKLVEAMDQVGFKRSEIAAYMGGNIARIIRKCIG